jgi:hypothetical protein
MSFQIIEILDSQDKQMLAKVNHEGNQITAIIKDEKLKDFDTKESFLAEIDYDKLLNWKVNTNFEDKKSGIWQEKDGVHLLGRVHDVFYIDKSKSIIDVYIQNGPEFFTVNSETVNNEIPEINSGLEIIVENLYIFPSNK